LLVERPQDTFIDLPHGARRGGASFRKDVEHPTAAPGGFDGECRPVIDDEAGRVRIAKREGGAARSRPIGEILGIEVRPVRGVQHDDRTERGAPGGSSPALDHYPHCPSKSPKSAPSITPSLLRSAGPNVCPQKDRNKPRSAPLT